jgi:hypothetical protein
MPGIRASQAVCDSRLKGPVDLSEQQKARRAVQTGITMQEGNATRTTSFTLAEVAGNAVTTSAYIGYGRARTITFTTDLSGQVIKRTESDNVWTQGDPSQMWFRFGGRQMGMVTNNGRWESTYKQSIDKRREVAPTGTPGAFANGASVGISEAPSPFGPFPALKGPLDLSVG